MRTRAPRDARYRAKWRPERNARALLSAAEEYETSIAAGVCADFGCTNPVARFRRCASCRRRRAVYNANYRARRRAEGMTA